MLNIEKYRDRLENYEIPLDCYIREIREKCKHYNFGTIEVIDVIEDWNLNFCIGNAIKYIGRCEHKGHKKEDLEKAKWYIEREIKKLEIQEQFKAEGNEA